MVIEGEKISPLFKFKCELIANGKNSGSYNMDFDYARVHQVGKGDRLPMFRLYGWEPWAVSLGAHQKETDFDLNLLRKFGFDLVRRPTGGRAVLHANELTYSFVGTLDGELTTVDVYRELHYFIVRVLNSIGLPNLSFEKVQTNFKDFYQREIVSLSCFASSARYEVEWNGKKIVGSAQRLFGNTLLQHGSILLNKGYEMLADVANLEDEEQRSLLRNYILSHSISISEIKNEEVTFESVVHAFIKFLTL
ncbi:MAG: hypothetical protein N2517_06525 [Ignavibacteria bacterium]|nr:hypothetical protein [Ignavibacteria bacterium]